MARLVLDKNPDHNLDEIKKILEHNTLNSIMYSEPFLKTFFLTKILSVVNMPVIYLDFDLLYSGYTASNIMQLPQNITLVQPTKSDFNEVIKNILLTITTTKSIIIIDSLNGFFNLFEESKDVARLINSYIMLLVCVAKISKSIVLLASMTKETEREGSVLSVTGRQILETKMMTKIRLDGKNSRFSFSVIGQDNSENNTYTLPINTELN